MIKINNIIVFVGGKGSRLGKITKRIPKPLIKFNGKTFLDYQLNNLKKLNPKKIILLCGYKTNFFEKKYKNKYLGETKLICIKEKKLLGTGGSLENSKKFIIDYTLVCNGDTYFDYDFTKIKNIKFNDIFLFLVKNRNYKSNNKLTKLVLKKSFVHYSYNSNLMNSGFYLISKTFKKFLKKGENSLENNVINELIIKKKIKGKFLEGNHIDIGTQKNLKYFKKFSKKIKLK